MSEQQHLLDVVYRQSAPLCLIQSTPKEHSDREESIRTSLLTDPSPKLLFSHFHTSTQIEACQLGKPGLGEVAKARPTDRIAA